MGADEHDGPRSEVGLRRGDERAERDVARARDVAAGPLVRLTHVDEIVAAFLRGDWRPLARGPEGDERPAGGTGAMAAALAMKLLAGARRELILRVDSQRIRESNAERVVNYAAAAWYPASGGESPA